MRFGIDWGGTKIEIIGMEDSGEIVLRERIPTPRDDYQGCLDAVTKLVTSAEKKLGVTGTVGIGIPGTISPATGLVKNANSTWMNGQPLKEDLERYLSREIRIANDANCFAVSEAVDGVAAGKHLVIGIIIGTGCGSGIAIDGKAHAGGQGIAGEFGHTPLAPMKEDEFPGPQCWCGRHGCVEKFVSGTGFIRDYEKRIGEKTSLYGAQIIAMDDAISRANYEAYVDRLGRGIALLVNILDPDAVVLGGGMSKVAALYGDLPEKVRPHVFSDTFETPILQANHGDSSGVRGAAWLW